MADIEVKEPNLAFVCLLTGVMVFLEGVVFCHINALPYMVTVLESVKLSLLIFAGCFIAGMFIHGIGETLVAWYMTRYQKRKELYGYRKTLVRFFRFDLPMKVIMYLFRYGTTIETLMRMKSGKVKPSYDWINAEESMVSAVKNIWLYALRVNHGADPEVMKHYYHSQFFQCFGTTFAFSALFAVGYIITMRHNIYTNVVFIVFNVLLHRISKSLSAASAVRFFRVIDTGLKYLQEQK